MFGHAQISTWKPSPHPIWVLSTRTHYPPLSSIIHQPCSLLIANKTHSPHPSHQFHSRDIKNKLKKLLSGVGLPKQWPLHWKIYLGLYSNSSKSVDSSSFQVSSRRPIKNQSRKDEFAWEEMEKFEAATVDVWLLTSQEFVYTCNIPYAPCMVCIRIYIIYIYIIYIIYIYNII